MAPSVARSIKDTMSDGPTATKAKTNVRRQEAAAAIRVELFDKVRSDWSFDVESPVPDITPDLTRRVADGPTDSEAVGSLAWVERSYSSSSDTEVPVRKNALGIYETEKHAESGVDPYQFDGPEAVGTYINDMRNAKRRRIRKATDEELTWNKSLQHWTKQRAAWTGERTRKVPQGESSVITEQHETSEVKGVQPNGNTENHPTSSEIEDSVDFVNEIPIPPPIIDPTAPIRSSVTKATYPQVYEKVCEAGMTPTIPINLKDVTLAMVQGWKKHGDWSPPKPVAPEPVFARRRKKAIQTRIDLGEPESPKHPHISKGVGAVKKALGISGSSSSGQKDSI